VAEIRRVFSERRQKLWLELAGKSKRSLDELNEIQESMFREMDPFSVAGTMGLCIREQEIRRCNRILKAIQDCEEELKHNMKWYPKAYSRVLQVKMTDG